MVAAAGTFAEQKAPKCFSLPRMHEQEFAFCISKKLSCKFWKKSVLFLSKTNYVDNSEITYRFNSLIPFSSCK